MELPWKRMLSEKKPDHSNPSVTTSYPLSLYKNGHMKIKETSCEFSVRGLYLKDNRNWFSKRVLTVNCKALPMYPSFSEENRMNYFPVCSSQNTKKIFYLKERKRKSLILTYLHNSMLAHNSTGGMYTVPFNWKVLSQECSCESNVPAVFSKPKLG